VGDWADTMLVVPKAMATTATITILSTNLFILSPVCYFRFTRYVFLVVCHDTDRVWRTCEFQTNVWWI